MKSLVEYEFPALSTWSEKLAPKLDSREYRHAYMMEGVKTWIARQVRALREQRDWSQGDLARDSGTRQSAISRIEDPDYGKLSLQTLFDLASAFDLPLLVQFTEWSDWLNRMEDVSTEVLQKDSFNLNELSARPSFQFATAPITDVYRSNLYWNLGAGLIDMSTVPASIDEQVSRNSGQLTTLNTSETWRSAITPLRLPIEVSWEDLQSDEDVNLEMPAFRAQQQVEFDHGR
jgi:transcriptional regulator with XRE-family HTH domain